MGMSGLDWAYAYGGWIQWLADYIVWWAVCAISRACCCIFLEMLEHVEYFGQNLTVRDKQTPSYASAFSCCVVRVVGNHLLTYVDRVADFSRQAASQDG